MKTIFQYFLLYISILTTTISCGSTSQLYRYDDKNKNYTGQLSDSVSSPEVRPFKS